MSLAQTFPDAVVEGERVYFIGLEAFQSLPNNSVVNLDYNERMSAPKCAIEENLNRLVMPDVDNIATEQHQWTFDIVDKLPSIPFEDKARLVFCCSFSNDKDALFKDFWDHWVNEKARIFKHTTVRFQKNGQTVMEMDI